MGILEAGLHSPADAKVGRKVHHNGKDSMPAVRLHLPDRSRQILFPVPRIGHAVGILGDFFQKT